MMDWIFFFTTHVLTASIIIFIIGATVGSFLNVVVYRYPIMLKHEWHTECMLFLNKPLPKDSSTVNLFFPRSHCTHCKRTLPFWLNIPILTYLIIRGQCAFCHKEISIKYLLIELITAFLSVVVFLRYGITPQTGIMLLLTWGLIALSFIDFDNHFLPDSITHSLLWLGLFASTHHVFISPKSAIMGAIVGYLFLYAIAKGYVLLRKKEGMGLGDCKMLAMMGAFVGATSLLYVVLFSTLFALIISFILLMLKKIQFNKPIPFGPFIAIGGWLTLIIGPQFIERISLWIQ